MACSVCSRSSIRLSSLPQYGIHEKVCEPCRNKITHRTCSVCGKYRKVAEVIDETPFCAACIPGAEQKHACPDCNVELPGAGNGRCRACLNLKNINAESRLIAAAMSHEWIRVHCTGFGTWLYQRQPNSPSILRVFRSHHVLLEKLDAHFANEVDVSSSSILASFSVAELRKHLLLLQYLKEALGVELLQDDKDTAVERERVREKLRACLGKPWEQAMRSYVDWLEMSDVKPRTMRLYTSSAAAFCSSIRMSNKPWKEDILKAYLRRHPGARANL